MKASHKLTPRLEGMESRNLLSGIGGAAAAIAPVPPIVVDHTIHLNGTVKGTFNEHQGNPDFPKVYQFFGHGGVGLKGYTDLAGTINAGGFTQDPNPRGDVFIATARGTITLHLTADKAGGQTDGLADQYDYTVEGGSGKYKNATGHGTIVLTLDPAKAPTTTTAKPGSHSEHGKFAMVFVS